MAFNAGLAGPLLLATGAAGRLAPGVGLAPGLLAVLGTALGAGFADLAGWTALAVTAADFFDFGVDIWEPLCCTPMRSIKAIAAAVCAGTERNLQASFAGEHLECSPCGGLACRERSHRLAGSGGAAVALAEKEIGLYLKSGVRAGHVVRVAPARFRRGCWRLEVDAGEPAVRDTVTAHWGLWLRPQWPGSPAP